MSDNGEFFSAMINGVIGIACLMFIGIFILLPEQEKMTQINEELVTLKTEKSSYGVTPFLDEPLDKEKRIKAKKLYGKYEELEPKANKVMGLFTNKDEVLNEIEDDKEDIKLALLK